MKNDGVIKCLVYDSGSAVNQYGEAIAQPRQWGEPIPACLSYNMNPKLGFYQGGEYVQFSIAAFIEYDPDFELTEVKVEENGIELGEHRIVAIRHIPRQGRTMLCLQCQEQ